MTIQPISFGNLTISKQNYNDKQKVSFGYSNKLKTLFKQGLLPTVKVDAAGNRLTRKNVTLDHIIPKSKGGVSCTANYMLAEKEFNNMRSNEPLLDWVTMEGIMRYLNQFVDVKVKGFNGNEYIAKVLRTLDKANEIGI